MRRLIAQTTVLYKQEEVTPAEGGKAATTKFVRLDYTNNDDYSSIVKAVEIKRPDKEVANELKVPARYVTLQLTDNGITQKSKIYIANGKGFREIVATKSDLHDTAITLEDANKILMQQVGFACKYEAGAAYFNIPVKHLGWYRKGNKQKDESTINWNIVRVGDFGIVRNHSYKINVTGITGLGTGIGGKDDPIIPPTDTQDYFVAYRVNILKWAVVPQQDVEL